MKRINKVGIDSIYSVIDYSENCLFFFENGRVISMKNAKILGNIQEYSPKDQLVDFIRIRNDSFIILVNQFKSGAALRKINVSNLGDIILSWDLELDLSISKLTRKLFYLPGKIFLTLNNHYFVIDESNGRIVEQFSLSTHEIFLFLNVDEMDKQFTIVYNELENEIQIHNFIPLNKNLGCSSHKIIIDPEKKILPNSGIITKSGKDQIINLLFVDNEIIGLFTYNLDKKNKNYLYSKVNLSSLNYNICSSITEELMLKQTNNGELAITLARKKYNKGYQILYIFESNPSYILESFSPINDDVQSSNALIFQDERNNSRFIVIISYNDLTNILSITTIFNYFSPIKDNKVFRYNLKIEYFDKNNKIVHGPIVNLMYSTNMDLLLQWDDSLLASISLNCDETAMKCYKPKINDIYEGVISFSADPNYFKNNILFFSNQVNSKFNLGNTINYNNSSFINGTNLYNYSHDSKPNSNIIFGTIMLTVNKYFSVFAYNIDNHQIIWRNDTLRQKNNLKLDKIRLFILKKVLPELIIIDQFSILRIEIFSGKTISFESYYESLKLIVATPRSTSIEQNIDPLLILIDKYNKVLKLLDLDSNTVNIKNQPYFYFANESNVIRCYKIVSGNNFEVNWQYIFEIDETISVYSIPECGDCKSFPVIVNEKYNIINRFDYPYLLGVITSKKKLLLFNLINGNLIYSSFLPQTFEPPFTLEIFQNIVLITSYHSHYKMPVILILELFQFIKEETYSGLNVLDKFIFLVFKEKNVNESKIYSERPIHIQETVFLYNYELPIDYSVISRTKESLASKLILFGSKRSNIIEAIPERLFTTLKPSRNKKRNYITNNNLPFYQSILSERIKFSTKFNSKKIFSFSNEIYESKSKLLSVGFNSLEVFELYPNTLFDRLPHDFNYYNIIGTVFLISAITAIVTYFSKRNQLKNAINSILLKMETLRNATCIPYISGKLIFGYSLNLSSLNECERRWHMLSNIDKFKFIKISKKIRNEILIGLIPLQNWSNFEGKSNTH
ncbi:signal peptide plus transmembrane domain or GPI anchor [Cryptosporidium sp. chipmunk genotype I]|uniref:signal peptide plus transmembrane domain or GPI anchor n=1 Tax=Cryptosporidium sp. chipmunk genotype I TaxID=1280935 RepID=UPI00351A0978|nr:signal peptide plus transmembrane domain or GPI anchor [Cryptosporidium sp. chipmunk genotype I]